MKKALPNNVQKPVRVKIPNSYFSPEENDHSICLFCRSTEKDALESYLSSHPIDGLTKIITLDEVRKYYKEYKNRKILLSEHSHFVCHSSIARHLYNLLGNVFSEKNNYPVQIDYDEPKGLASAIAKVLSSTYMHLSGSNITIKFGLTSMSVAQVTANLLEGIPFALEKIKGTWSAVHNIHVKTKDSPSLPIYDTVDADMLRYLKAKNVEMKATAAPAIEDSKPVKTPAKGKRKIEEEPAEQPVSVTKSAKKVKTTGKKN